MTEPHLPSASPHAAHDLTLIAALAARTPDLTDVQASAARDQLAACDTCANLLADLVALQTALPTTSTPSRPRDFALTPADAARLRRRGWRRMLGLIGSAARQHLATPRGRVHLARRGRIGARQLLDVLRGRERPAAALSTVDAQVEQAAPVASAAAAASAAPMASAAPSGAPAAGAPIASAPATHAYGTDRIGGDRRSECRESGTPRVACSPAPATRGRGESRSSLRDDASGLSAIVRRGRHPAARRPGPVRPPLERSPPPLTGSRSRSGRLYTGDVPTERLMLLDGYGLVYRGYFALPPLTTSKGELVNGVFGFASIVLRGIADLQPDYLAVSFDLPGPTFRHEQYADYKATRAKMPDDLRDQFPKVREVVKALRIPVYEMPGYEADDVIGTITSQLDPHEDLETTIVTVDLDMLQLVTPRVRLMTTRSGVENTVMYDVDRIDERFGLRPDQMIDYKALKGDPTDNIPGVPGVGEKTAAKLIREFGDLDVAVQPDRRRQAREAARQAASSTATRCHGPRAVDRSCATCPSTIDLEAARLGDYDRDTVVRLFREYEFRTLIERLPPMAGETAEQRTETLRSVAESGYVPAARVAGRPEGWGAGRAAGRPGSSELQLRLDFDAVVVTGHRRDRRPASATGPSGPFEPTDDLPAALAAAIVDPGRIEVIGADRVDGLGRGLPRSPSSVRPLLRTIRGRAGAHRWRSRSPGPTVARSPPRALRPPMRSADCSQRRASPLVGHEVKPILVAGFADDPSCRAAAGRLRHAGRGVHPQRGPAQPDHRRRRRGAPRPDPAAAGRAAGHRAAGLRRCRRWPSGSRSSALEDRGPGSTVPRGRAAADPGARADGGDRRGHRSRGAGGARPRVRDGDRPARAGDLRRRRPRVQHRQPQAARAGPVLRAEPAEGQRPRPASRPMRRCSRSCGGPPDGRQAPRLAGLHEAALDLRRGAAGAARRRRPPAHDLPPGRGRDRAPVLVRPEPPEHPDPHRARARIRRAFVAGEPDLVLLAADYSQIELRILAHVSGDVHLKEAFARQRRHPPRDGGARARQGRPRTSAATSARWPRWSTSGWPTA